MISFSEWMPFLEAKQVENTKDVCHRQRLPTVPHHQFVSPTIVTQVLTKGKRRASLDFFRLSLPLVEPFLLLFWPIV
jgi:hypothetical protein